MRRITRPAAIHVMVKWLSTLVANHCATAGPSLAGLSVLHHFGQRAPVQAQLATGVVDLAQDPLRAAVPKDLFGAVSADPLGAAVQYVICRSRLTR
jgi:hypothetical protein